jgi:hypothetical protein
MEKVSDLNHHFDSNANYDASISYVHKEKKTLQLSAIGMVFAKHSLHQPCYK